MTEDLFREAMRRRAGGVSLIATRAPDGAPHGLVATSIASVSAEPPMLLVCINRTASMHDPLLAAGIFCVNLLGDEHEPLSRRFSSAADRATRFSDPVWTTLATGAPALEGALACLDCRVTETVPASSHTVVFGAVAAVRLAPAAAGPLVHFDGRYRALADAS